MKKRAHKFHGKAKKLVSLPPQPYIMNQNSRVSPKNVQNTQYSDLMMNNEFVRKKENLAELNKAVHELNRLFDKLPQTSKYILSSASRRNDITRNKLNRTDRQVLKTYGYELDKSSERSEYSVKLPVIQNKPKYDSMQQFYLDFQQKSKILLGRLQKKLLEKNTLNTE